jgi:signal transduction histidine kinase
VEPEQKVNILLVDDNPAKLLAMEAVLTDLGQNLVKAQSGKEALRHLLHEDFAVILLDVNMPGLDGFEVAELIRQRKKLQQIPIIFFSAINQTEQDVFNGYSLGAVDYLPTPVSPAVLRAKVSVFVELYKKTVEVKRQAEAIRKLNAELEQRVAERTAELRRSNEELQQFAYVASHDLQEPLRMITSYVQLLAKRYQGKLDAEADEFISYVTEGAQRMKTLIDDLLAYSRVGTHGQGFAAVDCEEVLQRILTDLRMAIEESGAEVTHDPLPTVWGDATQLGQVLQNLLSNALKFRDQAPPQVHITARLDGGQWVFSVSDNGIGIDPQYAERIFVIFQRLHTKKAYPGTGIGLAICKKIVERHGGRIWVESQPGRGATFFFTLPAKRQREARASSASPDVSA